MRILLEDSLILFIDFQERLFPHINESDQLEKNCIRLLQGAQALSVPILLTQQYTKGLGPTIPGLLKHLSTTIPIEKICFSCVDDSNFLEKLKSANKKNIIISGIEAHICVQQTAIDLIEKGFQPVVVANCVGSRNQIDKDVALKRMNDSGAIICTYESILMELTRFADIPVFKEISKIIK